MTLLITPAGDTINAVISGRLDTANSQLFAVEMQPLMDGADKHIVLDCSKLEFVSSSGLRLLLTLRKQTIAMGGDVTIKNAIPEVMQVFTITGFFSLFKFE
ncbi:MAG: STAS domain-containing protein [Bacteroidales bacterium]|nr:STAS domain-containing protein [Candidatus Sodaliphilus fimicaballi]